MGIFEQFPHSSALKNERAFFNTDFLLRQDIISPRRDQSGKKGTQPCGARSCISWVIVTSTSEGVPSKVASPENPPYFAANMMEIGGWWSKCETLIEIHQSQKKRRGWDVRFPKKNQSLPNTDHEFAPLSKTYIYIYHLEGCLWCTTLFGHIFHDNNAISMWLWHNR